MYQLNQIQNEAIQNFLNNSYTYYSKKYKNDTSKIERKLIGILNDFRAKSGTSMLSAHNDFSDNVFKKNISKIEALTTMMKSEDGKQTFCNLFINYTSSLQSNDQKYNVYKNVALRYFLKNMVANTLLNNLKELNEAKNNLSYDDKIKASNLSTEINQKLQSANSYIIFDYIVAIRSLIDNAQQNQNFTAKFNNVNIENTATSISSDQQSKNDIMTEIESLLNIVATIDLQKVLNYDDVSDEKTRELSDRIISMYKRKDEIKNSINPDPSLTEQLLTDIRTIKNELNILEISFLLKCLGEKYEILERKLGEESQKIKEYESRFSPLLKRYEKIESGTLNFDEIEQLKNDLVAASETIEKEILDFDKNINKKPQDKTLKEVSASHQQSTITSITPVQNSKLDALNALKDVAELIAKTCDHIENLENKLGKQNPQVVQYNECLTYASDELKKIQGSNDRDINATNKLKEYVVGLQKNIANFNQQQQQYVANELGLINQLISQASVNFHNGLEKTLKNLKHGEVIDAYNSCLSNANNRFAALQKNFDPQKAQELKNYASTINHHVLNHMKDKVQTYRAVQALDPRNRTYGANLELLDRLMKVIEIYCDAAKKCEKYNTTVYIGSSYKTWKSDIKDMANKIRNNRDLVQRASECTEKTNKVQIVVNNVGEAMHKDLKLDGNYQWIK